MEVIWPDVHTLPQFLWIYAMIAPPVVFCPCPSPWQKTSPVHPSGKLSPCQGRDGSFPRRRDGRHLQGQESGACSDAAPHSLSEKRRWADFFSTSFNTIEALRRGNWWDIRWENRPPNCQKKVNKSIHIFKLTFNTAIWKSMSGENPMPNI